MDYTFDPRGKCSWGNCKLTKKMQQLSSPPTLNLKTTTCTHLRQQRTMSSFRGKDQSTGAQSTISVSTELMEDVLSNLKLEGELEALAETDPAAAINRMLSHRTATSTGPSFAKQMNWAQSTALQNFTKIGAGTCGFVYQEAGTTNVLKRAKTLDYAKQLWNDYCVHTRVCEAFEAVAAMNIEIKIPNVRYYIPKADEDWWANNQHRFPQAEADLPYSVLVTERTLPLMKPLRKSLTKLYCKPQLQDKVLKDPANADCLARVYLGSRRDDPGRKTMFFSLRNFKLHVDILEELKLDTEPYAITMAQTLAVMHWKVGCDARDVEFVLGSPPTGAEYRIPSAELDEEEEEVPTRQRVMDFKRRVVHLWLLDFNQVKRIAMDITGVKQAVKAFMDNDAYFPRPHAKHQADEKLWTTFKTAYLAMSTRLQRRQEADSDAEVTWKDLPQAFIEELVETERVRLEEKAAAAERT